MKNTIAAIIALFFMNSSQEITIGITAPKNNSDISQMELVRGTTSSNNLNVYILVHPMLTNLWYIQNQPSGISKKGEWQSLCYFGEKQKGVGEYFEVMAILTKSKLRAGSSLRLDQLPKDAIKSDLLTYKRTK